MTKQVGQGNWPVMPGDAEAPQPYRLYTTRYGDSLSVIALRFLKDAARWPEIYELNRDKIEQPDSLEKGIQLRIPVGKPTVVARPPVTRPGKPIRLVTGETCNVSAQATISPDQACFSSYTVRRGDSLSAIAHKIWHDEDRWVELYRANTNQIRDPELISAGTVLKVPSEEEAKALRAAPSAPASERKPLPTEREMLARAVIAEARGEALDVQMAVATAIFNYSTNNAVSIPRLVRSSYLSSNYDGNKEFFTLPIHKMDPQVWKNGVTAAEDAFQPDSTGRKLIGDRDHFYDRSIRMPSWGKKGTELKIGSMYFLKSR